MIKTSYFLLFFLCIFTSSCAYTEPSYDAEYKREILESVTDNNGFSVFANRVTKDEIKAMSELGVNFVRMGIRHQTIDRENGFTKKIPGGSLSADEIMAELKKYKIRTIIIVSGNEYTETKTKQPVSEKDIASFVNYAEEMAKRYGKQVSYFEIWNEPDLFTSERFWSGGPNPKEYAELALKSCRAIKKVNPDIKVIGPALAHPPGTPKSSILNIALHKSYLQSVVENGALDCFDAVSIHPYTRYPENLPFIYSETRKIIGNKVKIINSELGWSTYQKNNVAKVNENLHADYLIRKTLIDHKEGISPSIWYQWRSTGTNLNEREENFGITSFDGSERPALKRLKAFNKEMKGYKFSRKIECGADNYVWEFKNKNKSKLAIWNGKNQNVTLQINNKDINAGSSPLFIDIKDKEISCKPSVS